MLREQNRKVGPIASTAQERSGKILGINANGTYSILVGDTTYEAVPSGGGFFYRPGEFVSVTFRDERPVILP